jgi:hypothetical protein
VTTGGLRFGITIARANRRAESATTSAATAVAQVQVPVVGADQRDGVHGAAAGRTERRLSHAGPCSPPAVRDAPRALRDARRAIRRTPLAPAGAPRDLATPDPRTLPMSPLQARLLEPAIAVHVLGRRRRGGARGLRAAARKGTVAHVLAGRAWVPR